VGDVVCGRLSDNKKRKERTREPKQVNNKQLVQWQNVVDTVKEKNNSTTCFCSTQHNYLAQHQLTI